MKKAPQKLLNRALIVVCANIVALNGVHYVRPYFSKGADQKFFAELFFKKATSPARRRLKKGEAKTSPQFFRNRNRTCRYFRRNRYREGHGHGGQIHVSGKAWN